ncbi:MAG: hypothetical protein J0L75_07405 [Spirochaetes bacterium]|nr:hypothetical protein [Spirochaetota bacterium]
MEDIRIDTNRPIGPMRPLHGVNGSPVSFGGLVDSTAFYRKAGFPFIRLHDTNWPHPREVDIPQIFPDFSADPLDPASYDFRRTDALLDHCQATGAQLIYRLGVSIEHTPKKYFVDPPSDFEKWALVCLQIVRHVNEGWADGHRRGILHWELWNEPDNQFFEADRAKDPMWSGTPEQYFDLYAIASRKLKEAYPALQVGGYAASRVDGRYAPFLAGFLARVVRESLPLDFFSWHRYAAEPQVVLHDSALVRRLLDAHGLVHTRSICDEWNYCPEGEKPDPRPFAGESDAAARSGRFSASSSHKGASFCAATLIGLHDAACDTAAYYDASPTNYYCTLFDRYGYPQKPYYAFVMYQELKDRGARLAASPSGGGLYALASGNPDRGGILVTAWEGPRDVHLHLSGLDVGARYRFQTHLTDGTHCHTLVEENAGKPPVDGLKIHLEEKATLLLTWDLE